MDEPNRPEASAGLSGAVGLEPQGNSPNNSSGARSSINGPNAALLGGGIGTAVVAGGYTYYVWLPTLAEGSLDALAGGMTAGAVGLGYGGPIGAILGLGAYESYENYPPPGTCSGLGCPAGMSPY